MSKDKYNPVEESHLQARDSFDALPGEEKQAEVNRLHEQALIENVDSFYKLTEKETDDKNKEELLLALRVCEVVKEKGGLALVVGGFARDAALGKFGYDLKPKDIDIEVYGLEADVLKGVLGELGKVDIVGEAFQVFKLKTLDISIPRRDSKTGKGHKGFKVEGDPNMLVMEAARRRDFTINALALDPLTGEILDFYGGIEDIEKKNLRATDNEAFAEDPLRVLRAMQFAARFGFNIDQETVELCRSLDLGELSPERIGGEWLKLLDKAPKPSIGLEWALKLGVLDKLHPELKALIGVPQNPEYHPEGDVWTHTKLVLDSAADIAKERGLEGEDRMLLILSAICHDLGKPATTIKNEETGKVTSYGHEEAGLEPAKRFLDMLYIKKDIAEKVLILVKNHMFIHNSYNPQLTDSAIRRRARDMYPVTIKDLVYLSTADYRGALRPGEYVAAEEFLKRSEQLKVESDKPKPLIGGRDLLEIGFKPGPTVGKILKEIEELQLDGKITNFDEAINHARVSLHITELGSFGLAGLEGRIQRGLDPAGMLAVGETRKIIEEIIANAGANIGDLERITKELHIGAIWNKAEELAKAESLEIKAWMLLAHMCHEVNDKDLSREEYLTDVDRIKEGLQSVIKNPEESLEGAVEAMAGKAQSHFVKKDGVPFSEEDTFIYMAIAGEKFGVFKSGDLYFVGADELDYSLLEKEGFIAVEREDRGRAATFYQKDGKDIVKKLYPGLAIVFGDEGLALSLAKNYLKIKK